jgi:uncharacterized protein (TIGR03437 family)
MTPLTLNVVATPGSLTGNTYTGSLLVQPQGGNQLSIPVNFTVSALPSISFTPTTIQPLSYVIGSTPPTATLQVTGSQANTGFTASVTSGADWLSVSPTSGQAGTTATPLTISLVNATNLTAGQAYNGSITVSAVSPATGSQTINVTLNVTAPLPTISRVTNGASFNTGDLAAGEIVTIFGTAMGPTTLTPASPSGGQYPTTVGGVQVTIGYRAPLIYVRNDQIAAIVPYEINRPGLLFIAKPTVIVFFAGQSSNGITLNQVSTAPGIFTTGGGTGQGAILNKDLSVNSAANPATKGDPVVVYLTGEGQTSPGGVSGRATTGTAPFPVPVSGSVTATVAGQPAQVVFAAEAPTLVSGVLQVNLIVPQTVGSGDLPIVVSIGGVSSQLTAAGVGAVTVAVK